jgi:hypothetical protein
MGAARRAHGLWAQAPAAMSFPGPESLTTGISDTGGNTWLSY